MDSDRAFNELALEIFHLQRRKNPVYRRFVESLVDEPSRINRLEEVPFLPLETFKNHRVFTGEGEAEMVFTSTGTTGTGQSRHYIRSLKVYERAFRTGFKHFFGAPEEYRILALLPSYLEREGSSLIYMMNTLFADSNHPYGHARIETVASGVIGALLLAVAIGFVVSASGRLLNPDELPTPSWITLWPAVIAVIVKEALFHYTRRAARRVKSALIDANAWHHRSDALSSVVVIGGIGGALLGAPWLDALAAILVAGMIGHMGWNFVWKSLQELVDTGLGEEEIRELRERIMSVDGVLSHHQLRTRRMGPRILVDVHIQVDGESNVREAHGIAQEVRRSLLEHGDDVRDVMVSVEPGDREHCTADDEDGVRLT